MEKKKENLPISPVDIQQKNLLDNYIIIDRNSAKASYRPRDYSNLDGVISGRPGLTPMDYYSFRPDEAPPSTLNGLITECERVYHKVGIIRNIIDLMGDFASQGIRVVCTNKKEEKIYRKWWEKVDGKERSERFLNNFYRTGNVYVRILTGKVTTKVRREMKSVASPDINNIEQDEIIKNELPIKYVFLDPRSVRLVAGSLSSFVGKRQYELVLPGHLKRLINSPKTPAEQDIVNKLPADIVKAASSNIPYVFPENKIRSFFYKKDDWGQIASPMLEGILDDIQVLEKLKLADMAALDGATANIRIFKLGNMEYNIPPTPEAAARLASLLQAHVGAGTYDIIWGPDIELVESKSTIHQFLGEEKYRPHLNNIYTGVGIPPTLTGTFGAAGTTNNFISLKTLIERLQYGRDTVIKFWSEELKKVQEVLGLSKPARIEFNRTNLADETQEKALWIQLVDRGLVSEELIQYVFGADPDTEYSRLQREEKERSSNKRLPKAGPWHDPQFEIAYKKIALQGGYVTLDQLDVEVEESKEPPPFKQELEVKKIKPISDTKKGVPGQGRPKNKKDTQKRKTKTFTPKSKAIEMWANAAQTTINILVNPHIQELFSKKNMRSLSYKEYESAEIIKFGVLCNLKPMSTVNETVVAEALRKPIISSLLSEYNKLKNTIGLELNRELNFEEKRKVQAIVYAEYWSKINNDNL